MSSAWFTYLVRCTDNSLYAGVTTDLSRRIYEHNYNDRLGAKYTRVRRPVTLVYAEKCENRKAACQREYQVRKLSKAKKELLIEQFTEHKLLR